MDFPVFHLDFMGNRMLIAVIAIVHVIINHAMAVGLMPLVTILEYRGFRLSMINSDEAEKWDNLAYKILFVAFVVTTSFGALTGVGIWFSVSLVNPASIGSLIRVFYGAWFTEWIVFVLEVGAIMVYFLTWKSSGRSEKAKRNHVMTGTFLSIFSWLTMAVIVAILGFMMDPGNWLNKQNLITGFANPIYLPQLLFRTPVAMIMAGTFALFLSYFFLRKDNVIYKKAIRMISFWILFWTPYTMLGAYLYYYEIPNLMIGNLPVAIGTQQFIHWYSAISRLIIFSGLVAIVVSLTGLIWPKRVPRLLIIFPVIFIFFFMGYFERIREFIRKPYVIGNYMYANAILENELELYQKEGILKHATYVSTSEITEENKLEAGQEVFLLSCTRCHTTQGINSVVKNFEKMYGKGTPFNVEAMKAYIAGMHNVKSFMPPFPGNSKELDALAHYIKSLQEYPKRLEGAQTEGVAIQPRKININPDQTD